MRFIWDAWLLSFLFHWMENFVEYFILSIREIEYRDANANLMIFSHFYCAKSLSLHFSMHTNFNRWNIWFYFQGDLEGKRRDAGSHISHKKGRVFFHFSFPHVKREIFFFNFPSSMREEKRFFFQFSVFAWKKDWFFNYEIQTK